jgi:hypothetical protein
MKRGPVIAAVIVAALFLTVCEGYPYLKCELQGDDWVQIRGPLYELDEVGGICVPSDD